MGKIIDKNYKTWHERIIEFMSDFKWRSNSQIKSALGVKFKTRENAKDDYDFNLYWLVNSRISELVRSGHLIRANAPKFLSNRFRKVKYVYKYSGKPHIPIYEAVGGGFKYVNRLKKSKT